MKFKLNRGKSIKLGDKEIPISTTDGWTDIPDDEIIEALSNAGKKHGQPDWSKEDETDPGYIKNKPGSELIYSQSGLIDLSAIEPGKAIKISNWNAWLYSNYQDLFYADTLKDGLVADKYEGPFYKWKSKFTFVSTGQDIGLGSWSYYVYDRIERIDSINYMIHIIDTLYIVVVFNYSVLPSEYANEIKSNGFFGYMKEEGAIYPSKFNNWNAEIIFGYTRPMSAAAVVPSVKKYFQRKEIQDTADYFSTKTVEGALEQLGSQLDKYFGYTIDESSKVNATYIGKRSAKVPLDSLNAYSTWVLKFKDRSIIAGRLTITDAGTITWRNSLPDYVRCNSYANDDGTLSFFLNGISDADEAEIYFSTTVGETAFEMYKITMHDNLINSVLAELEPYLPESFSRKYSSQKLPVYIDEGRMYASSNIAVNTYFTGSGLDFNSLISGGYGYMDLFLQPASVTDRNSNYDLWGLSEADFPIICISDKRIVGSGFPDFYCKVITSSGRQFRIGGSVRNQSSWTPSEIFPSSVTISSSTEGSSKKFKITVDDTGTLSATEVTD